MKILQLSKFYYPYMGGIELVAEMISKAHTELGHEVDVISFGDEQKDYTGRFKENVYQFKTDIFKLSTPISFKLLLNPRKILRSMDYDRVYVHLHNPFMHLWLLIFGRLFQSAGIKIVGVYHSDLVNQKILGPLYELFFLVTCSIFDYFIVSSPKLKEFSSVMKFIDASRVHVVPFPVKADNVYRRRTHFTGKLLAIGRSVPYKGFEFLINAINKTDYELNIIGAGPLFDKFNTLAADNVHMLGRVSDEKKDELIQSSDVLIVSSINKTEAYGMIIVEALQSGLPVIASNINTGVTFLVQEGKTGLTFEPLNEKELLEKLQIISRGETLSKLSEQGHDFYQRKLTFNKFKQNLSSL